MYCRDNCTNVALCSERRRFDAAKIKPTVALATGAIAFDEPIPDEFINMALTSVLMHEVGHTLGLRHNFRGSTYFTHDELGDPEFMNSTERHGTAAGAITSSIMDCKLSS